MRILNRTLYLFSVLGLMVFLFVSPLASTHAAENLELQIPVPDHKNPAKFTSTIDLCEEDAAGSLVCNGIPNYFLGLYIWIITAAAIVAVVILMAGGMQWMTSRGSSAGINAAKKKISNALIGIVLLLGSYSLLYLINPALTVFKPLNLGKPIPRYEIEVEVVSPTPVGAATGIVTGSGVCGQNLANVARQKFVPLNACVGACHCSWFVSQVLKASGCSWDGNAAVPSLEGIIKKHGWTLVSQSNAVPGDIVIWPNTDHVAIYGGNGSCIQSSRAVPGCDGISKTPNVPTNLGAQCAKAFPAEQSRWFSSGSGANQAFGCNNAQCIGEIPECGNGSRYYRAPTNGGT